MEIGILWCQKLFIKQGENVRHQNAEKWNFNDKICSVCNLEEESGEEILNCKGFGGNREKLAYTMFFSDLLSEQLCVGKAMLEKLKVRRKIREEVTWNYWKRTFTECSFLLNSSWMHWLYSYLNGYNIYIYFEITTCGPSPLLHNIIISFHQALIFSNPYIKYVSVMVFKTLWKSSY